MTKLSAVNHVLRNAGGYPVRSLDTDGPSAAAEAERCIDDSTKTVQQREWNYNTRHKVTLSPDTNGYITVPAGTLHLDTDSTSAYRNITFRGQRLFDVDNNTEIFTEDITVTITSLWEFHCIPEPLADYVVAEAAFTFNSIRGDRRHEARLIHEVNRKRDYAVAWNTRQHDVNIINDPDIQEVKGRSTQRNNIFFS